MIGKGKIVGVDVDEVCANLLGEWLRRYNDDYADNLLPEDITGWSLGPFVKQEAKNKVYDILREPNLYGNILPIHGARKAVREIRGMGYRVVFVTSCVPHTTEQKRDWLLKWGFLTKATKDEDFAPVTDKSLIRAHYLFDDRPKNVLEFPGIGVMVTQAHNAAVNCPYRVNSLADAPAFLRNMEKADYQSLVPASPDFVTPINRDARWTQAKS